LFRLPQVYNSQYVIAGGLVGLEALKLALDAIKKLGRKPEGADLANIVLKSAADAKKKADATSDGWIRLDRGQATIPLTGLDTPFHSRKLMPGVPAFRAVLVNTFSRFPVRASELVGRYIPNVLGTTFSLRKEYLQSIFQATDSEIVKQALADYERAIQKPDDLCRTLVIELLSYQFASPVQVSARFDRDSIAQSWSMSQV
jgi:malonyl CoA-acyl carrier protein transacylase